MEDEMCVDGKADEEWKFEIEWLDESTIVSVCQKKPFHERLKYKEMTIKGGEIKNKGN